MVGTIAFLHRYRPLEQAEHRDHWYCRPTPSREIVWLRYDFEHLPEYSTRNPRIELYRRLPVSQRYGVFVAYTPRKIALAAKGLSTSDPQSQRYWWISDKRQPS